MTTDTLTERKYIPVKMEFDYCIMDAEIKRKGFSDKLCEHMKKEDAELICNAVNNHDNLLSTLKKVYSMMVHKDDDRKGNRAKTDIFKYCPEIGELYCKIRATLEKVN